MKKNEKEWKRKKNIQLDLELNNFINFFFSFYSVRSRSAVGIVAWLDEYVVVVGAFSSFSKSMWTAAFQTHVIISKKAIHAILPMHLQYIVCIQSIKMLQQSLHILKIDILKVALSNHWLLDCNSIRIFRSWVCVRLFVLLSLTIFSD